MMTFINMGRAFAASAAIHVFSAASTSARMAAGFCTRIQRTNETEHRLSLAVVYSLHLLMMWRKRETRHASPTKPLYQSIRHSVFGTTRSAQLADIQQFQLDHHQR